MYTFYQNIRLLQVKDNSREYLLITSTETLGKVQDTNWDTESIISHPMLKKM